MVKLSDIETVAKQYAPPIYTELLELRERVDDCLAGQKTIKSKKKYLPPNKWQLAHPDKYDEFLRRALFPSETKYSLDIYEGLFHLGEPLVKLPEDMLYLIHDASVTRDGLHDIQVRLNKEQMTHGLRVMLAEVRNDPKKPFFVQEYGANRFLRAHFTTKLVEGESIADAVLLNESRIDDSLNNWIVPQPIIEFRLLALDRNMEYYQRSIIPEELNGFDFLNPPLEDGRTIYPDYRGRRFNRIPLVWCGATGLSGVNLDQPPLLPMADTELKLYMAMAHNSQHIYMNTQESIVITGADRSFNLKDDEFVAGAVINIPGEHSNVKYLSTNGLGFDAEEKEIARLQASIEAKRLSLMSAKTHQSGTVVGLVQNSQSAPLRTVVDVSGNAIRLILKQIGKWMGHSEEEVDAISYIPSEEFANPRVNLSEFIALCNAVDAGTVPMLEENLYSMARESGFVKSKLSWENFKKKYEIESLDRQSRNGIVAVEANPANRQNPPSNQQEQS